MPNPLFYFFKRLRYVFSFYRELVVIAIILMIFTAAFIFYVFKEYEKIKEKRQRLMNICYETCERENSLLRRYFIVNKTLVCECFFIFDNEKYYFNRTTNITVEG